MKIVKLVSTIIDEQLKQDIKKSSSPPSFKPSMLGSKCLRKIFYSYNRVIEDYAPDKKSAKIMHLGNYVGDMISKLVQKSGQAIVYRNKDGSFNRKPDGSIDSEFVLFDEVLDIKKAKIDEVIKCGDKVFLLEYKSANDRSFSSLNGPKDDHKIQGTLYYYIFNKMLEAGEFSHISELDGVTKCEGVIYVYYNKNDSSIKEFLLDATEDVFIHTIEKIDKVTEFTKNDVLPPKTEDYCGTCPWRTKCSKNQKN